MALRTLVHGGAEWTVWNVVPMLSTRLRVPFQSETVGGWLCFQSQGEKRRIVPVPDGWEDWPEDELARRLDAASIVHAVPISRVREADLTDAGGELQRQVGVSMERARELGERVRLAMVDVEAAQSAPDDGQETPRHMAAERDLEPEGDSGEKTEL